MVNRFEIHLANVRILPCLFRMTKRRVEDAALPVHLAPGHGKIVVVAVDAGIVLVVSLEASRLSSTLTLSRDHALG